MLSFVQVLTSTHCRSDVERYTVSQWLSVSWLSSNGDDSPSLVLAIIAVPPDNVLVGSINTMPDIKTFLAIVLDASSAATKVLDWLSFLTSPGSDVSLTSDSESISTLVGKDPVSVVGRSDGVGS